MISSASIKRRLIPRWRTLRRTIESRELAYPRRMHVTSDEGQIPPALLACLARWRVDQSVVTAAELVESAIVHAREQEAVAAARLLTRPDSRATPLVRKHAGIVLMRTGSDHELPSDIVLSHEDTMGAWRARTRLHPRDALAWVELALAQVSLGNNRRAFQSMAVALQLAPHNRHVLRSAARLFVHAHDPERAYDLIRRNAATPYDPWLMAAEIALAAGAERKPRFFKKGIALLEEGGRIPREVTELAGALGTTFLVDGNRRRGKRLFQQSLTDPTGNSLAQAEWVTRNYGEPLLHVDQLQSSQDANEAMVEYLSRTDQLAQSLIFVDKWAEEERFSARPYWAGASTANFLEKYEEAERLARLGLRHDPKSLHLLQNLVFALANLERLDEAERLLDALPTRETNEASELVTEANRGLLAFRRGQLVQGEAHYQRAIRGFRRQKSTEMARLAQAYLARESARAGTDNAHDLLAELESINPASLRSEMKCVVRSVRAIIDAKPLGDVPSSTSNACPTRSRELESRPASIPTH